LNINPSENAMFIPSSDIEEYTTHVKFNVDTEGSGPYKLEVVLKYENGKEQVHTFDVSSGGIRRFTVTLYEDYEFFLTKTVIGGVERDLYVLSPIKSVQLRLIEEGGE